MTNSDALYELLLKDKSVGELYSIIRRLKREISFIKNTMEHPEFDKKSYEEGCVQIKCKRFYIEIAKEELSNLGIKYQPTKSELKSKEFDAGIREIECIVFLTSNAWGLRQSKTIIFKDNDAILRLHNPLASTLEEIVIEQVYNVDKEALYEALMDLHIGEWRADYNLKRFNYLALDGEKWEFIIKFKNGKHRVKKSGINA